MALDCIKNNPFIKKLLDSIRDTDRLPNDDDYLYRLGMLDLYDEDKDKNIDTFVRGLRQRRTRRERQHGIFPPETGIPRPPPESFIDQIKRVAVLDREDSTLTPVGNDPDQPTSRMRIAYMVGDRTFNTESEAYEWAREQTRHQTPQIKDTFGFILNTIMMEISKRKEQNGVYLSSAEQSRMAVEICDFFKRRGDIDGFNVTLPADTMSVRIVIRKDGYYMSYDIT